MNLEQFAKQYGVKTRKDSCGETIIPGKPRKTQRVEDRRHTYENGDGHFGLCYVQPSPYPASVGKYHNAQKRLLAAGFTQAQDGDSEGTFLFDPANAVQSRLAIKEIGARVRRPLAPEKAAILSARLAKARLFQRPAAENGLPTA